ncbi:unnamed protein product [Rhizopus microsporus]
MCGRFACSLNPEQIVERLHRDNYCREDIQVDCQDFRPSYNVAPIHQIVTLYENNNQKSLKTMEWGYVPSWIKKLPINRPINARQETLEQTKGFYVSSKDSHRCVIVAEGFYEWKKPGNGTKQPYYIKRKDGQLMMFAGLYDINELTDKSYTCAIVTTEASKEFSSIHTRMPVILNQDQVNTWIDGSIPWSSRVIDLMKSFEGELESYQVTDKVGSVKNDFPGLVKPIDSQRGSISQFLKPQCPDEEKNKEIAPFDMDDTNKKRKSSQQEKITDFFNNNKRKRN